MLQKYNNWLYKVVVYFSANSHLIALFLAFVGINLFVLGPIQRQLIALSGGVGVLDLLPWYTYEEAIQRLNVYGEEGRKLHLIAEWTGDLFYPAIYALLFSGVIYRLGGGNRALLSVYSAHIDWLENIMISLMLWRFPDVNPWMAQLGTLFTGIKWSLALCNVLMILFFLGFRAKNRP